MTCVEDKPRFIAIHCHQNTAAVFRCSGLRKLKCNPCSNVETPMMGGNPRGHRATNSAALKTHSAESSSSWERPQEPLMETVLAKPSGAELAEAVRWLGGSAPSHVTRARAEPRHQVTSTRDLPWLTNHCDLESNSDCCKKKISKAPGGGRTDFKCCKKR